MKKLVIFDLDGTLFYTGEAIAACGNYALEKLGLSLLTTKQYTRLSGMSLEPFITTILKLAGDEEAKHRDAFWQYYLEKNFSLSGDANVPYEGVEQLLQGLKERGVHMAVLSNKDHASCVPIVEEYFGKECFAKIQGGLEHVPPKPDPAACLSMVKELGLTPADCLYVGDTEVDMQTGANAGIDTVAALWGYREKEELAVFSPKYFAENPLQLLQML